MRPMLAQTIWHDKHHACVRRGLKELGFEVRALCEIRLCPHTHAASNFLIRLRDAALRRLSRALRQKGRSEDEKPVVQIAVSNDWALMVIATSVRLTPSLLAFTIA
jgi:hypothetical protein